MSAYIFDINMTDENTIIIRAGERLYRIITGNPCDDLYIITTPETADDDARAGMRAKFGRRGPDMIDRLEDVTFLLEEAR